MRYRYTAVVDQLRNMEGRAGTYVVVRTAVKGFGPWSRVVATHTTTVSWDGTLARPCVTHKGIWAFTKREDRRIGRACLTAFTSRACDIVWSEIPRAVASPSTYHLATHNAHGDDLP